MLGKGLIATGAALLVSCSPVTSNTPCLGTQSNLIQDADFAIEAADRRSRLWRSSQHAGEISFDAKIKDGVLTITKTGSQPWFVIRQTLQPLSLAGQRVVFRAELQLDLQLPEVSHGFGDGGWIRVSARSENGKLLESSPLDQEPHIGSTGWEPVQVFLDLPENTHTIDLSILHQAEGIMKIRNPYFGAAGPASQACDASGQLIRGN